MKIGIVMPCLKYYEGAIKALESVRTSHDWTPFIQPQWREDLPLSQAWNRGINKAARAGCDYVLVINDDIIFSPATIDALVDTMSACDQEEVVLVSGDNVCNSVSEYAIYGCYGVNKVEVVDSPDFSCFLVRPDILSRVGLFDQNFIPAYFEDNDYHYRIKLLGFKGLRTTAAPYYHRISMTQNLDPENPVVTTPKFEGNRAYYVMKWGGEPGDETFVTPYNDPSLTPKQWLPKRSEVVEPDLDIVSRWIERNLG